MVSLFAADLVVVLLLSCRAWVAFAQNDVSVFLNLHRVHASVGFCLQKTARSHRAKQAVVTCLPSVSHRKFEP